MLSSHDVRGGLSSSQVKAVSTTLHLGGGVVLLVEGQVLLPGAWPVPEVRVFPVKRPHGRLGVGVEQELVGVEAVAVIGVVRPVHPVTVELPEPAVGQVAVPDPVRPLPKLDPLDLLLPGRIKETKLHPLRVLREQGEVDALTVPGRAERIRHSWPDDAGQEQVSVLAMMSFL